LDIDHELGAFFLSVTTQPSLNLDVPERFVYRL